MSWDSLFQIGVLLAGSGATGIAVKAFFDRHKLKVDGVAVLSDTALEQLAAIRTELNQAKTDIVKFRTSLHAHEMWDRQILRTLADRGIEVDPPPELYFL